ncbi:alpha/beta hydrolase [Spongiibacter sp. KMU-158]|uniref:Alpha/beta hydrolase n=1 Tax=Spongiibacter pelagi TaxID=2760804 RepID=A0A927GVR5_9GAMM|nr:alpha/beta hydrolase [Spongiibacter pelagi]MBD2858363.1 alpha/beta hydrolase [Spongiibacter pelagi]
MSLPVTWLFLRGLSREHAHWGDFPERCKQELGWNCIHLDLAGFGSENHRSSPLSIPSIRADLQTRLNTAPHEKIGIIALSLGGMVALDWLATEPERFSHSILINSSTADCPPLHRLRLSNLSPMLRSLGSRSVKVQERNILNMVSNQSDTSEALEHWCQIRQQRPVLKSNVLRQLAAAAHFRSPAKRLIANPPLFIASKADRMVSWRCSERLAKKYRSALLLHESAGHDLPLDDSGWLIEQLKENLGSL